MSKRAKRRTINTLLGHLRKLHWKMNDDLCTASDYDALMLLEYHKDKLGEVIRAFERKP